MIAVLPCWWRVIPQLMAGWYLRRAQRLEAKAVRWRARDGPVARWYLRRAQHLEAKAAWWRARAGPDAETLKQDLNSKK